MRILFYTQQLSGVGHFVRTLEIAKQVSRDHEVWMVDGGRPVPRTDHAAVRMLPLPRIHRVNGSIAALNSKQPILAVMADRTVLLKEALRSIRPDAVIVEHYPFSKWELEREVNSVLNYARTINPKARAICSVRDIPLQTRHEDCSSDAYVERVLQRLHDAFDGLMIHGDSRQTRLEMFFPGTDQITLPTTYTGIVAENISSQPPSQIITNLIGNDPYVIASAGGGSDTIGLLDRACDAWRHLKRKGKLKDFKLLVFSGLADGEACTDLPEQMDLGIFRFSFSPDYFQWMQSCRLSISCAGYNTCANILRASCRAILVPNMSMSDQLARAKSLANIGLNVLLPTDTGVERMADEIISVLSAPEPHYSIDLDGAIASERFIRTLTDHRA